MSVQQFCLRWNNHQPNFISVCSTLLHNGTLVDVTLAAEGRQLQAHKIVLSACSSYFQNLFTTNPCQHPIVILKDVQYNDLKTMVDFMYYGEVNVSQEQLPHILKTAEMLKIKGLAEMPDAAASLTKSDSKSSSEPAEQMQGSGDSLWGSTDSQFQQQQTQQQPQQSQQQQQQQQQPHQHHHHQQQQQQQQQHPQQQHHQLHQQRRSPSPISTGVSPSIRRKRLRKSSTGNKGSIERSGSDEQHHQQHHQQQQQHQSNIETSTTGTSTNLNLSQINQISFSGTPSNLAQSIHTKIIKESSSTDTDTHPQDSSQESIDDSAAHHVHQIVRIKPEIEMSGVPQSIPLDISGPETPSELETPSVSCPQSQTSHTGVQWTVVGQSDDGYPRFSLSSCQANLSIDSEQHEGGQTGGTGNIQTTQPGNSSQNGQQTQQQQNVNNQQASGSSVVTSNQQQQQQQGRIQMHYPTGGYATSQIISVNNLVSNYSQSLSTPTSPTDSAIVQSVYSQDPTPTQSPVHQSAGNSTPQNASNQQQQQQQQQGHSSGSSGGGGTSGNSGTNSVPTKRKRSVNPQGDENFLLALEAVRTGGIGFCKAARIYGVNNRTLWLEYKKRGYPICRPSIKNRIKLEPNLSPAPPSTPTNEDNTIENYESINQPAISMQVPSGSETPTPIMCPPHAHPMGVMSFLDTRHMEFPTGIHTMSRQRYNDGGTTVNVNSAAMNLQGLNFNSM